VSHPQANAQCARFLRERLRQAEIVAAPSTADAVRIVADSESPWAALGTRLSAELNGCRVLLEGVEDHPENETRFVWLGRKSDAAREPVTGAKTSVVFWGVPDAPGALMEVLRAFAVRNVNLSKIESRPLKQGLGRYIFFADIEGARSDPDVAAALDAVAEQVGTVRVLGSYPASRPTAGPGAATG
jgi:prephenate dehydratase